MIRANLYFPFAPWAGEHPKRYSSQESIGGESISACLKKPHGDCLSDGPPRDQKKGILYIPTISCFALTFRMVRRNLYLNKGKESANQRLSRWYHPILKSIFVSCRISKSSMFGRTNKKESKPPTRRAPTRLK